MKELSELYSKEERMWKQKSKNVWLKEGDRNTRYFYGVASSKMRNNRILKIKDDANVWYDNKEDVKRYFWIISVIFSLL